MAEKADTSLSFWAERVFGLLVLGAIIFACFWIARPLTEMVVWGALAAIALVQHRLCMPLARILEIAGRWQRCCS